MNDPDLIKDGTHTNLLQVACDKARAMVERIGFTLVEEESLISNYKADNITQILSDETVKAVNANRVPLFITLMRKGESIDKNAVCISNIVRVLKVSNFFNMVIDDNLDIEHLPPSLGKVYIDLRKEKTVLPNDTKPFMVINEYSSQDVLNSRLCKLQNALYTMGHVLINEVEFIVDEGEGIIAEDYDVALKFGQVNIVTI